MDAIQPEGDLKAWFAPFAGVSLMAAIGWSSGDVTVIMNPPVRSVRTEFGESSLAGQFQTSASGWLWTYTEVYFANGVKLRRMTREEKIRQGLPVDRDHGTTVIPAAGKDYRGILGDVEREVSAWSVTQRKGQNDPRQCLPLFRLMTWLDPHFVEGWTNGAMVVGMDQTPEANQKALEFLREGLKHNPDCVDIPMMFGMFELRRYGNVERAVRFFRQAIENGKAREKSLSENERNAWESAFRWMVLASRKTGQIDQVYQTAQEGLKYFPDDAILTKATKSTIVPPQGYVPPVGVRTRSVASS